MSKISINLESSITRNILAIVFLIIFTALTVFGQAKTDADVRPLTVGNTIERELKSDEAHSYSLVLQAGQFLNVVVEQKGVDVVVSLFDSNNKKLAEVDSPNGTQGAEPLSLIIETTGNYRLEVRSLDKSAPAGHYEAKIIELRAAAEKDKNKIAAQKVFAEGEHLESMGTAESLRSAIRKYEEAIPLYRIINDKDDEATMLNNIGTIYNNLGEQQKALEYYTLALPLFRAVGDKSGDARTLNNIGKVYNDLGDKQQALKFYNEALPLHRAVGDKSGEGNTLNNIGTVYDDLGDKHQALKFLNDSLPILRATGDKNLEAAALLNIGKVYNDLGEKQQALKFYSESLPIFRAAGDKRVEALTLNKIGLIYSALGEKQQALKFYNESLPLSRAVGDKRGEAAILSNIGAVYFALGEKQQALKNFNESLALSRTVGNKGGEASTLNNIGRVYDDLGDKQQALKYFNESLLLRRVTGNKSGEAVTLTNIGAIYNALGEKEKALEYYQLSLPLSKSASDKTQQAKTLDLLMVYWKRLDNLRLAVLYGKQSVNLYQELRQNINALDKETQKTYLKTVEGAYRRLGEILISQGRIPEAEQVLAMLKEEEFFQFVRRGDLASALDNRINLSPSEKDALERNDKIADELTQLGSEYAKLEKERNKPNITDENAKAILARQDAINEKLKDARIALDKFLEALKQEFSQQDKRVAAVEEGLQAEVKGWGDPYAVVISTIVGKENLSIIVTTSEIQTAHIVPISEGKINTLVGDFRAALTDPNSDPKPVAQKLYDVLIKPLEKDLNGAQARTLIWSLDGNLRYAPMAALWDKDKGYLIQRYANVVITLASRGNLALRPEGKKAWQALGVGVSKAVGGFQALSYVPEELDSIVSDSSIAPKSKRKSVLSGKLLLDEKFTSDAFRSNLGRYPIVHAATHFSFISGAKDEALESFLLLGSGEKLTLAQIQNSGTIFNGVQLLALSACDTAYGGKDADGREIEGFGALAQKKGAKAVMATLWRVADESTRDLMVNFYDFYQKDTITKAKALRQAQLALLQEPDKAASGRNIKPAVDLMQKFKHPYYWGSYILIGNWW